MSNDVIYAGEMFQCTECKGRGVVPGSEFSVMFMDYTQICSKCKGSGKLWVWADGSIADYSAACCFRHGIR